MKSLLQKSTFFLAGIVIALLVMFLTRSPTGELRRSGPDAAVFGVKYDYGAQAREAAAVAGIRVPVEATDVFYGIGGFKDVWEFIAFTVPAQSVWSAVAAMTGKQRSEARDLLFFKEPGAVIGPEAQTVLFSPPASLERGVEWKTRMNHDAGCVVDEQTGRVFIVIPPAS